MNQQIPKYTITEFTPKKHKYAICVFVINEWEKVQKQIKEMTQYSDIIDIIIADGWSSDGSLELNFLREYQVRTLLTKKDTGKLSTQMRMAFDYCEQQWYEWIVVVDGNGKDDLSAIPNFIQKLDEGYGHIQWSRYIPGWIEENTPSSRKWWVKLLHAPLISLAARWRYTDTTNGFRAYSIELIQDNRIQVYRDIFSTYELHYYLAIKAARLGYKCIEIPVTRRYPKGWKVPTKIKWFRGNTGILKILLSACIWKYNPK